MKIFLFCFLFVFLQLTSVNGGGFGINTQGIKSMAAGSNSTLLANDASLTYAHPAAITTLNNSFTAGIGLVFPRLSYLSPFSGNVDMKTPLSVPFHLYGNYKLSDKFAAGISINTPFSANVVWEDDWTGRYVIISNRFKTLFIQPTIAYSLSEKFSIGGGPVIGRGQTIEVKALNVSSAASPFAKAEFKSSATGIGFNAGVLFNSGNFSLAASYHSAITMTMKGDLSVSQISQGGSLIESIPASTEFETEKSTPSMIKGSLALSVSEKVRLAVNAVYYGWKDVAEGNFTFTDTEQLNFTEIGLRKNSFSVSVGGQYDYSERTRFYGGVGFENSSFESRYLTPAYPDADNLFYSAGFSWQWKASLKLDIALMIRDYKSRIESANIPFSFNGEYKTTYYSGGAGISYEF